MTNIITRQEHLPKRLEKTFRTRRNYSESSCIEKRPALSKELRERLKRRRAKSASYRTGPARERHWKGGSIMGPVPNRLQANAAYESYWKWYNWWANKK